MKIKNSKWYYIAFTGITGGMLALSYQHLLFDKIGCFYFIPIIIHVILLGCIIGKLLGRLEAHEEFIEELKNEARVQGLLNKNKINENRN